MFTVGTNSTEPIILDVWINDVPIKMEFDTGASVSILNEATYRVIAETSKIPSLEKSDIHLKTYNGEAIKVLGATTVNARYANQEATLSIQVVEGAGPDLMGRDWLAKFEVTLGEVNHLEESTQPQALQVILDKSLMGILVALEMSR